MGDLDGGHADAASSGVDEDALAFFQAGNRVQRIPGGHENDRQRRRFLECHSRRHLPDIRGAGHRMRSQAEDGETENAVAGFHMGDARANRADDARHFVAEDPRIRRFRRIECECFEHIPEIHAPGHDLDHHLARTAGRQGKGNEPQGVQQSALTRLKPQRHRGIQLLLARREAAQDPPDVADPAPEGDLTLGVGCLEFVPQERFLGGGSVAGEIDPTAGEILDFVGDHAHDADRRPLADGDIELPAGRLCATGHHIDPQLGGRVVSFQGLGQVEDCIGSQRHRLARRVRLLFIEAPQIDEALRHFLHAGFKKLFPIGGIFCAQRETVAIGAECRTPTGYPATHPAGGELRSETVAEAVFIGKDQPGFLNRSETLGNDFHRTVDPLLAGHQADEAFAPAFPAEKSGERLRFGEAGIAQHRFPLRALKQRMVRAQFTIREPPPAAGESEDGIEP